MKQIKITGIIFAYAILFLLSFYSVKFYFDRLPIKQEIQLTQLDDPDQFILDPKKVRRSLPIIDSNKLEKKIENSIINKKEVFLTFDDGPSTNNTPRILQILNEFNVKANFFVVGKHVEEHEDIVRSLFLNGMTILSHSHSHDYKIYKNTDAYIEDLNKCNEAIKSIINQEPLPFIRLPGGSDNKMGKTSELKNIRSFLKEKDIKYVDWNVSSTDAAGVKVEMSQIRDNVIKQCKNTNFAVVLMHDSPAKTTTVEALPYIIRYLKSEGFVFRTFEDISEGELNEMIKRRIVNR